MFSEWFGPVYPSRVEGGTKMVGALFQDTRPGRKAGMSATYLPDRRFSDHQASGADKDHQGRDKVTIVGVDVDLIPVAGETTDVLLVWLPQKKS